MAAENPTWGAPRIHGELLKLGFKVSEPTVSRWLTFLRNHREAIAAMDFFTLPTLTFGVLYCFFVISHDRRKILRCNVSRNPTALSIGQQMREAWPSARAQRFLLFDRDAKFGKDVISAAKKLGTKPIRTAFRSPWQNGVAECWVGSCRRDLLDHVIVLNERHLQRLMRDYNGYYHEDRTIWGRPRTRRKDAQSRGTRPSEAGFTRWLDSVACIIVTPWQRKRFVLLATSGIAVVCMPASHRHNLNLCMGLHYLSKL